MSELLIYQAGNGNIQVKLSEKTVWLSLNQMADLFDRDKSVISRHLRNIFHDEELVREQVVAKNATTANDGKTYQVEYYNLDAIISIGYRVNSKKGTQFRQWATKALNDHLTHGFSINQQRFEENAKELEAALALIRKAAATPELEAEAGRGLVEIVSRYTQTFLWLQRYDEGLLNEPAGQTGGTLVDEHQAMASLHELKKQLIQRGEATELFAKNRDDGLGALLGNLEQTTFGEPAYPTVESKAAHLLYFVVKNHPFVDGNKRSGAFLFVDFLYRNGRLMNEEDQPVINDTGLAALTLLVAESDPKQKDILIRLIMNMLTPEAA
ncbi:MULTISPECIES: RhuM family protein [unclassified Endozoicomonas]|uniref:RhuM family protein n=1 Tax=unclassified Endozoicomonas TaxID=2644528 RepID=UPI003BB52538